MWTVKALTQSRDSITVCASMTAPTPFTFRLFEKVLLLMRGRIAYFGNNGGSRGLPLQLSSSVGEMNWLDGSSAC